MKKTMSLVLCTMFVLGFSSMVIASNAVKSSDEAQIIPMARAAYCGKCLQYKNRSTYKCPAGGGHAWRY